jgi:uncharacterized protein (TIGR03083 family)
MTISHDGAAAGSLPSDLRERVLAASQQARPAGRFAPAVPDITPIEAFARAAAAFDAVLVSLDESAWSLPVLRDLDVQALVGHLIGVEADVRRSLAGDPAVADVDHVDSTQADADAQTGQPPAQTRAAWRRAADDTLAEVAQGVDLDGEVAMHGMRLSAGDLLVVRAFELWTHENDIRRAAGLPLSSPDASTLQLMTGLAVRLLPHGVTRAGLPVAGLNVHLVLTGPGGGTWDVALGEGTGDTDRVSIVTDAVEFCRLVANRVAPDDLDLHVTGNAARTDDVLLAASALALD